MSQFSLEYALANSMRIVKERKERTVRKSITYVLYYSNNGKQPEGKIQGYTVKQLISEFRALGKQYQYAFVTKINDSNVIRFYNSAVSKKFLALNRTRKAK